MITVQIAPTEFSTSSVGEVEIICDTDGLLFLKRQIDLLLSSETHVHLMSNDWGGNELEGTAIEGGQVVHQVRIQKLEK